MRAAPHDGYLKATAEQLGHPCTRGLGEAPAAHDEENGVDHREDVEHIAGGQQWGAVDQHDICPPASCVEERTQTADQGGGSVESSAGRDDPHTPHTGRADQTVDRIVTGAAEVVRDSSACGTSKCWWTSGDLRSASSTSTCCPAFAKLAARLAMVVVFPSPA